MAGKPAHDTLIHCEACGEDYSSTYRRCPFCGARNDPRRTSGRDDPKSSSRYIPTPPPARDRRDDRDDREDVDDTYVFDGQDAFDEEPEEGSRASRPRGGKRLAPKEGGGFELPPVNWPRLITFLCSLVIIVAALVIVFTYIYPKLHKDPPSSASAEVSAQPSPDVTATGPVVPTEDPAVSTEPVDPSQPVEPSAEPSAPVTSAPPSGTSATVVNAGSGLRVRSGPGTSYNILASLRNGDPIKVLAPADNGWYQISFSGAGGTAVTGYIKGEYISTVSGGGTTTTQPPTPTVTQTPSGGSPTVGKAGTIVNATGGLRVRSGPSTSHEILATLLNGNSVTVLADAGDGWYQIRYAGYGGAAATGYIKGEYISTD